MVFLLFGLLYLYTSLFGKYKIIERVVGRLHFNGDEQVLDLGTGHGAFLIEIAKRLHASGKAIGLDIWNQGDQLGNAESETQRNIDHLGVSSVTELVTGDMTSLKFEDNRFDYVVASMSIHNVKPKSSREHSIDEAYRVLKPGGKIIILDIEHIGEYRSRLQQIGIKKISVQHGGIEGMYGALSTRILIGVK
ncbi:class I SAM-dependent methyltransferase [Lentilactobacillus sp. SPB1-3]|uniref:Class I SAM-dependent methyltransferase n=1 Tax=Lentilactobacillus terminaliae TaxID=3003483 RepID=A0ACD5DEW7_9LACO|nr:class I SAM-dependent methyltransferase [Lentilactobacillus sp. SPB1-3]MCZ0977683.1 class I SAM-dependent methyltransferase [Lentilactobacillus sp. SPB1-3]